MPTTAGVTGLPRCTTEFEARCRFWDTVRSRFIDQPPHLQFANVAVSNLFTAALPRPQRIKEALWLRCSASESIEVLPRSSQ